MGYVFHFGPVFAAFDALLAGAWLSVGAMLAELGIGLACARIVFRDGAPRIVIGAPGGSFIAPAVAQGISNMIVFGMPMLEAVTAPRILAVSDSIDVLNRLLRRVTDARWEEGYDSKRNRRATPSRRCTGSGWRVACCRAAPIRSRMGWVPG